MSTQKNRAPRRLAALVGAGLVLGALGASAASVAFAHDQLLSTDPAAGSTVTELTAVTLQFAEKPLDGEGATVVEVVGPDGRYYETDCPSLNDTAVSTPVALGAAGTYRVEYKVVSDDGHPVSDTFTFTYAPATGATAAAGSAAPTCGAAPTPTPTVAPSATVAPLTPSATPAPSTDAGGSPWGWVAIGAAAFVAAVGGGWMLARRRRS